MKKTKKALASLAIAGMALTTVPFNALADNAVPNRLAGTTAEQTAVQIAEQMAPTSGIAILASSASYGASDALTAGPLAAYLKAPILLQGADAALNADTKAELSKLNVKTVYVTSGTAVIKQSVLNELQGMGISVESLGGTDRFETSVNIAKKMVALGAPVKKVAVAYGWLNQDALSIAAVASAANEPILLTEKSALPASAKAFLAANGITSSDVIGGTGVIDASVMAELPSPTRHFGQTAYDTNNQVIQDFASSLKFDTVYLANGKTGIDALAGAPLAAMTDSPIVLTDGADVPAAATFVHGKMSATGVVTALGGAAVVPDAIRTGVSTGQVTTPAPQGALAVTSVTAVSANSFKVVFNQAPADTSKIAITVQRSSTPVTVTTSWNDAKTEATVTSSQNLPEGDYSVAVKNDTTDLGTSKVSLTQQKIAKISITSSKLAVNNNIGYATYKVYDQYGNDITTSYLSNNISVQSGAGTCTKKNGLITLTPTSGTNLITYSTIVISASDSSSGVSTNASLATSTAIGTLSNLTLNKLTNVDNKDLTAGDTASVWYIDYTATDISGNDTKDLTLVQKGLIDGNLVTSDNDVTAVVDQDPTDTNKAVIKVTVNSNSISADMPVTITAMTYAGTTSTLNLTLHKQSKLDSITLMAPSYDIASGESKVIPFVAYDQNGTQLTKYADLKESISGISLTGCTIKENIDGTASIYNDPVSVSANASQSTPEVLTVVTSTGKLSTITLQIQKPAVADTLSIDSSVLVSAMQEGAVQDLDFGFAGGDGGLSVKDQYGRAYDMVGDPHTFVVRATSSDNNIVSVSSGDIYGNVQPLITAGTTPGQATLTFKLIDSTKPTTVIDSKTVTISVIKNDDIKDYTIDTVKDPILATVETSYTGSTTSAGINYSATANTTQITGRNDAYAANPYVWGTTAGGAKVVLAGTPITGAFSSSSDFVVEQSAGGYKDVSIVAKKFTDTAKTGSSTTLTVTLLGADGKSHTVTTPITSSTTAAAAKDIKVSVDTSITGVSQDTNDENVITIANATALSNAGLVSGNFVTRFDPNGNAPTVAVAGSGHERASIYLYADDSYGTKGLKLAGIYQVGSTPGFAVNSDGVLTVTAANIVGGSSATFTGVTENGLSRSIKIIFAAGGSGFATADTAAAATLNTTITTAQNLLTTTTEGTAKGNQVVGSKATLSAAITVAQAVAAQPQTTAILNTANTTLNSAITTFNNAVVQDATLTTTSAAITGTGTATSTVTLGAGETARALTSDDSIATADVTAGVVTVTGVAKGSATITVQVLDTNGHVIKTKDIAVTVS